MIIISDIDGSLCESIFDNTAARATVSPAFTERLLSLPLLDWVDPATFREATLVVFVTGRGIPLNPVTATWIQARLGIHSFQVVNVPFTSHAEYVSDKKRMLGGVLGELTAIAKVVHERVDVIEDDPSVLPYLVKEARNAPVPVFVHAVRDGERSFAYPVATDPGTFGGDFT
jgi:hypothetical protein